MGLCRVGRDWRVTRALLVQLRLCRAMLQSGAQSSKIRSRICGQVAVWTIGRLEHAITEPHRKRRVTEQLSQLQSPRSENLTAKHSRLRRPCTAPPVIASYNNRRCHNKNQNVVFFFLGRDRGVTGRFFAAIGGVQFSLFSRGPLLRRQIRRRSSFSCFYRGMKRSRSGSSSFTNKLPQNHSEPPFKGEGYPLYLIRGEY